MLLGEAPAEFGHVRAGVAVFGQRGLAAERLQVAGEQGAPEQLRLRAGVVDVVLALHVVAGGVEHGGQRVAEHRASPVADLQRPGRVGGDEFDLHLRAAALVSASPVRTGRGGLGQPLPLPLRREPDVEEAGPCRLDLGDRLAAGDPPGDRGGDVERRHPHRAGQPHRHVAGVVAVLGLGRALDPDLRRRHRRQRPIRLRPLQRSGHRLFHQVPRIAAHAAELPGSRPAPRELQGYPQTRHGRPGT